MYTITEDEAKALNDLKSIGLATTASMLVTFRRFIDDTTVVGTQLRTLIDAERLANGSLVKGAGIHDYFIFLDGIDQLLASLQANLDELVEYAKSSKHPLADSLSS
ncbi:hypothetical protein [Parvularcula sp. LCG005]|uniref:hypothetical protein n=1 Tax=Parvularcula sp. LCG005 TaxID=3078805 RepID=UPI0029431E62|nr:hypothetical protein [Parvularcula sp. LCG005]WOI51961.1 hypothetical protein RUI03_07305 [Parvularcula sp. LCG005]